MSTPSRFPYYRISCVYQPFFYKFKNLPLLKIGLSRSGRVTKPQAFIDTGSQYCLFNNEYAKFLGIEDFKKVGKDHIIPLMGIGGQFEANRAYFHEVELLVYLDQQHLTKEKSIVLPNIEVGFLEKPIDIGGVLGVYGFLDRFIFTANIKDGYFEIGSLFAEG
ncbi:MAG: hypothetical protein PHT59_00255 [Candidatus Omnitrophica bacterium]|nr:hypothetical protein [Candidatus Omnitrophota bacterium]